MAANNNDKQEQLNKALGTLKAGGTVPINKTTAARQVDGVIYIYNPQVVQAFEFVGNKQKTAAAVKAGKISPISKAQLAAALNPKPSVPKPTGSKKPKRTIKGTADDDKGKKKKPKVKLRKDADPELATGKRLKNPLGSLSSYNYQISLYMMTPDGLELFKQDGFRDINKIGVMAANAIGPNVENDVISAGAYLIAQSGGVNNEFERRAPSFGLDYYIDSLSFDTVAPKDNGAPVTEKTFQFKIIEPYGFSFISNMKRANDAIKDYVKRLNKKKAAVAKRKAAAQQQRTRRKGSGSTKQNFRYQESLTEALKRIKGDLNRPKYRQNAPFQSDADILAPLRGKNPTKPNVVTRSKYLGKDGKAGATNSAGKPKGTDKSSGESPTPYDPTSQFFVLGIRFFGYDASGRPVRGTDTTVATNNFGVPIPDSEQQIDPGNSSYNLFERYYPITFVTVNSKVDGRTVTYDITAQPYEMSAIGTKRGIINNDTPLTGETVGDLLDQLMTKLNKEQAKLAKNSDAGYSYDIKYLSEYDADRIRNSRIVSKADLDKYKWPGSGAKNTKESNANTETTKNAKPKNNARKVEIAKGTPIVQAINQIIAQSSFLEDALRTVYTTALEPDQEKEDLPLLDLSGKKSIEWIQITPDIDNLVWDDKRADWVYDINYMLNIYDTPVIDAAYTNPGTKYYGPAKRYDYWYSGTNTEILAYEQKFDKAFYSTVLDNFGQGDKDADKKGGTNTKTAGEGTSAGTRTPLVENQKTGQPTQGKQGNAMEAQNSYLTALFDPSGAAMATVTIMGDPDWLMAASQNIYNDKGKIAGALTQNESVVYNKFYGGDGYSISSSGGQVFFEIDFKEAIDYKSEGVNIPTKDGSGVSGAPGTLSINSSILFWKDPKALSTLVRGLSYTCNTVRSEFRQGVFRQILSGSLNSFGDSGSNNDGKARENKSKSSNSGAKGNATTKGKGFKFKESISDVVKRVNKEEAALRYSKDKKVSDAAWKRKQALDDKKFFAKPQAGTPTRGSLNRNNPET